MARPLVRADSISGRCLTLRPFPKRCLGETANGLPKLVVRAVNETRSATTGLGENGTADLEVAARRACAQFSGGILKYAINWRRLVMLSRAIIRSLQLRIDKRVLGTIPP